VTWPWFTKLGVRQKTVTNLPVDNCRRGAIPASPIRFSPGGGFDTGGFHEGALELFSVRVAVVAFQLLAWRAAADRSRQFLLAALTVLAGAIFHACWDWDLARPQMFRPSGGQFYYFGSRTLAHGCFSSFRFKRALSSARDFAGPTGILLRRATNTNRARL